jgi:hypothetical protein
MEWMIAAAVMALIVGVVFGLVRKSTPSRPKQDAFVCHSCGERHCQCDRQT